MRRLELVDLWKWVGYCFLQTVHDSLAMESDCQVMIERANCLEHKKFLLFLGGLRFLVILSVNANVNMLSASR